MVESIHAASLYFLAFALAVYAIRWRSVAQRELRAQQFVENQIVGMLEATRRRVQKRRNEAKETHNEHHDA